MADPRRARDFVMGFVENSERHRRQSYFTDKHREVLANFLVEPWQLTEREWSPYRDNYVWQRGHRRNRIVLKDPETHKAILTYASKMVVALFGDREHRYLSARPVGLEDALGRSETVSRLLRYAFSRRGTFRTFVESIFDMLLFGTSVIETTWKYDAREMPVRIASSELGIETFEEERYVVPVYDDVALRPIDIVDFYPDPSRPRIEDMSGAAKRFRMNPMEGRRQARSGHFDPAAVDRAIAAGSVSDTPKEDDFRRGLDRPLERSAHPELLDLTGYEYRGEVPWEDDDGTARREIVIWNGVVVRDEPWSLMDPHLPWQTLVINPMQGRFYGLGPGETMRFDQSFADALKVLLAEAVIRQVHPPIIYDTDAGVDLERLRAWQADAPIGTRGGVANVGTLQYGARIDSAFGLLSSLQASMQGAGGALGGLQGAEGPSREAASVGTQRIRMALDRPELVAMVLERECLPQIGSAILRRYQQFLGGVDELRDRIGESPEPTWIGDIMGDYDIEFVGSRIELSKQERLQSWDRLIAMSAGVPELRMQIPWDQIARDLVGSLLMLPEIAAKMPDPQTIMKNMLMSKLIGGGMGGPARNGVPQGIEPPGMPGSQMAGGLTE